MAVEAACAYSVADGGPALSAAAPARAAKNAPVTTDRPRAVPRRCAVWATPPAAPASWPATSSIISTCVLVSSRACEADCTISPTPTIHGDHAPAALRSNASASNPSDTRPTRAPSSTSTGPRRCTIEPTHGDREATTTAPGRPTRPASSGVNPMPRCRKIATIANTAGMVAR